MYIHTHASTHIHTHTYKCSQKTAKIKKSGSLINYQYCVVLGLGRISYLITRVMRRSFIHGSKKFLVDDNNNGHSYQTPTSHGMTHMTWYDPEPKHSGSDGYSEQAKTSTIKLLYCTIQYCILQYCKVLLIKQVAECSSSKNSKENSRQNATSTFPFSEPTKRRHSREREKHKTGARN